MTEENPKGDKSNENADQTVSTPTDISQNNCEKNAIELESNNVNKNTNDVNTNSKSETSGNGEDKIAKNNLDGVERGSGGENEKSSFKDVPQGTEKIISTDQNEKKVEETEEEDIPGDFFDDFLKEDFMAGLDIVDDDAWEKELEADASKNTPLESTESTVETKKKERRKSPEPLKSIIQKKKKIDDKQGDQKHAKSKEKPIDADEFDIRRDPEKTKRDIEQYKAKCEKDKEKKIISEKLSLVETGLVPPGMEMEMDMEEVKRQKKVQQNQPPRDLRERLRKLRSKSKSPNRRQRTPKRKSVTRRSASPSRKSSPKKRRTRSPKRDREEVHYLFRSPTRRSRGRSYERTSLTRRSRSHSPYYRGRRSRYSPFHRHRDRSDSRESEREKWLRRRRTRSRSPRRKREEKKSFLQEIAEKLNETRPPPINIMPSLQQPMHFIMPQPLPPVPAPVPAPTPVPPPNNPPFFPPRAQAPQQQFDPYDQNFFIGTPQPIRPPPNFIGQLQNKQSPAVGFPQPQIPLNPLSIQPLNSPQLPNSSSPAGSNMSRNMDHSKPQTQGFPQGQINAVVTGNKEDLAKLFQDKKITLSEFLAITAKPEVLSSSPANLQEKIKVIQRCHEAIKILGSAEKKYTGKLVVHRTDNYKMSTDTNMSPLLRKPMVRFPFTQIQPRVEQIVSFTTFINNLLQKLGLMKETVVDVEKDVPPNVGIAPTPRALSPPPPPLITHNRIMIPTEIRGSNRFNKLGNNQLSKMIQTDVSKCESCEKRKKIIYKSSAAQCGGDSTTFSVSTQVTEDDFYPKSQKTQSLASLTPAQLLAKSRAGANRMIDKDSFDIAPSQSSYANRLNFLHPADNSYNLPRYRSPSPPPHFNPYSREEVLPSMYNPNTLRSPFIGGGGRGNPSNLPRTLDAMNRFGYNNYY
ncbi:hypothetical protein NQ314_013489 [Rhamnusium bicolor]|uniref:Uncharacterized protein n=1 Tax=Rhamnusium bicolor TaxID=1586634 RepID=A0AAV8X8E3_9CUCU|nr:hypothetical protein NQ314_013489 [Rhamnusium bicolor]